MLGQWRWARGSKNAFQAGKELAGGYCGVLWGLIGDLDYLLAVLKLPNFNAARPCGLCRCSLSGANSWSNFSKAAPWRSQLWTLTSWKAWGERSPCALFQLSYCSALTVHLDYMHCKYLGVDQYTYASVLALLCCQIMDGTPQENLNRCWRAIKQYCAEHNIRIQYKYLNKLTMFLRKNGTPKLRGKAGEIRHVAPALAHLWSTHMDPNLEVHKRIHMLLRFSVRTEQLITINKEEVAISTGRSKEVHWCLWKYAVSPRFPCKSFCRGTNQPFYADIKMPHATTHCSFEPMPQPPTCALLMLLVLCWFIYFCIFLRCCYAGPAFTFSFAMFASCLGSVLFLPVRFGALQVKTSKNERNSWHSHQWKATMLRRQSTKLWGITA